MRRCTRSRIRCAVRRGRAELAEAWRKRRYEAAFISKLSDSEGKVAETQVHVEFAVKCGYLDERGRLSLSETYDAILGTIVGMINHPETWVIGYHDRATR